MKHLFDRKFLLFIYFLNCSLGVIEDFHFQFHSTLVNKLSRDQAIFYETNSSPIRCIGRCALKANCVSIFLKADLVCQGYSEIYGIYSTSLAVEPGTRYYTLNIEGHLSCKKFGYTWNSTLSICYKVNHVKRDYHAARSNCLSAHPGSRLLLVDSLVIYNFLLDVIVSHSLDSVYLQGSRTGESAYLDEDGRPIPFFQWDSGQPEATGNYLRTDEDTRLQETSLGAYYYAFVCRIYNIY